MKIENYLFIKSMRLATNWHEASVDRSGGRPVTNRVFSPLDCPKVRMEIFSRGIPLAQEDSRAFRKILSAAPTLFFDSKEGERFKDQASKQLASLAEALGNIANNQLVNWRSDYLGPSFIVERVESLIWNNRMVLAVRGWFRDPDDESRGNDFCGFFIDTTPHEAQSQIEEIFLEAPNEELFLRYLPAFKECLTSIEWLN